MLVIQIHVIPKWVIKGYDLYVFGEDKKLYNVRNGKEIKAVVKGYTIGYNLAGKFMSRKQIKPLLRKYKEPKNLPF